ncbi:MAG TPA: hypothetical protein PKV66_01020 [Candidatus Pelethenecus sp.]|nr:hypothetical protein [Candidatus Pelethenecus sp.]
MKIGDIVEIIYNKEEYSWREIGSIGIITHPFGKYNWIVDIINPVTREKKDSDRLKEEQLRVLDTMPKENKVYTTEEIEEFKKIYEEKESELRNFKEYDVLEIIRDRPEYAEEGFRVGDLVTVCSNIESNGKVYMLGFDKEECADIDLSVRREDVRFIEDNIRNYPHKYTEEEKQELIKLSDELAKFYKQKDEERQKKYGY